MRTHTLLHWNEEGENFRMHFFPGAGSDPMVLEGRREDHSLVFEGDGPMGPMRQTFVYGGDAFGVTSEARGEDGDWVTQFEGRYSPAN